MDLLLVSLDDGGRTWPIRSWPERARVSLPQQIPTLIGFDLDGFQPDRSIGQFPFPYRYCSS
jgi:hypothetical protein